MPELKTELYGKVDEGSQMPAWYHRQQLDNMKRELAQRVKALEEGRIPPAYRAQTEEKVRQLEQRVREIEAARPRPKGQERDVFRKAEQDLGERIADSMPTHEEIQRNLVTAHEEVEKLTKPCIKLTPEAIEVARKIPGIKISKDGEVSRNDAQKVWKLCRRINDESSNVEKLRRKN